MEKIRNFDSEVNILHGKLRKKSNREETIFLSRFASGRVSFSGDDELDEYIVKDNKINKFQTFEGKMKKNEKVLKSLNSGMANMFLEEFRNEKSRKMMKKRAVSTINIQ